MILRIPAISYPSMNPLFPEASSEKQEYVRSLFDGIAHRYDFLNHFLSFGFDVLWRKRAIRLLSGYQPRTILDLATGTADLAIEAARNLNADVTGVDISSQMLEIGQTKIQRRGLSDQVHLKKGKAEELEFKTGSYDAVTVAFGVRNFSDVALGLREMVRVLRPGGVAVILEFSRPRNTLFRSVYGFYFHRVLPFVGGLISRSRTSYEYLPNSVRQFPDGDDFLEMMRSAGFAAPVSHSLTMGIATIYLGTKNLPTNPHEV